MKSPLVTILIPTFNGERFLREAIQSAIGQTYEYIEVIVIDDGSDDIATVRAIVATFPNVKLIEKANGGVSSALNLGISQAKGEYICWLSVDDLYLPEKIERQVAIALNNPDAVIFSAYDVIDDEGRLIETKHIPEKLVKNLKNLLAFDITYTLNGCTLLIPKKCFYEVSFFNEKLKYVQDYELWWKFVNYGINFYYLDEILFASRRHSKQTSITAGKKVLKEADWLHSTFLSEMKFTDLLKCYSITETVQIASMYYNNAYFSTTSEFLRILRQERDGIVPKLNPRDISLLFNLDDEETFLWIQLLKKLYGTSDQKKLYLTYQNVWNRGGVERVLSLVLPRLASTNRVVLITSNERGNGYNLDPKVFHLKITQTSDPFYLSLIAVILKADLFIGNTNIFSDFIKIYPLLKYLGVRTIAVNHGYYFLPYSFDWMSELALSRKKYFSFADCVTWPTPLGAFLSSMTGIKTVLLENPNTLESGELKVEKRENVVLCLGRYNDYVKRFDRVLKVQAELEKRGCGAKFIVGGGIDLDTIRPELGLSFKQYAKIIGANINKFEFIGEVVDSESFLKKGKILLQTSESEGFGMVMAEAACVGTPILAIYYPGIEDMITQGVNGYYYEEDKIPSLANKMVEILSGQEIYNKISNGAKTLSKRFDSDTIIKKWEHLIDTVAINERELDYYSVSKISKDEFFRLSSLSLKAYEATIEKLVERIKDRSAENAQLMNMVNVLQSEKVHGLAQFEYPNGNNKLKKVAFYWATRGTKATLKKILNKVMRLREL